MLFLIIDDWVFGLFPFVISLFRNVLSSFFFFVIFLFAILFVENI